MLCKRVKIVVVGDKGTGKSSLIFSANDGAFEANVSSVLPIKRLNTCLGRGGGPAIVVDTESRSKIEEEELKTADTVIITYACNVPQTAHSIRSYWLPKLKELKVKAPIILVGCMRDLGGSLINFLLEEMADPDFSMVADVFEVSVLSGWEIPEIFVNAYDYAINPISPLLDQAKQTMSTKCATALKRIFDFHDRDGDGALNDIEFNTFQVKCFNVPLVPSEITKFKEFVRVKSPEGVNENGITLAGFLRFHKFLLKNRLQEHTWTVLRKFGYNNDLELATPEKKHSDHKVPIPLNTKLEYHTYISQRIESAAGQPDLRSKQYRPHPLVLIPAGVAIVVGSAAYCVMWYLRRGGLAAYHMMCYSRRGGEVESQERNAGDKSFAN